MNKRIRINGKLYESVNSTPDESVSDWASFMAYHVDEVLNQWDYNVRNWVDGDLFDRDEMSPRAYKEYKKLSAKLSDILDDLDDLKSDLPKLARL